MKRRNLRRPVQQKELFSKGQLVPSGVGPQMIVEKFWVGFDPRDEPRHAFNVRLNPYYLAILRSMSDAHGISMQRIVQSVLRRRLRKFAEEHETTPSAVSVPVYHMARRRSRMTQRA